MANLIKDKILNIDSEIINENEFINNDDFNSVSIKEGLKEIGNEAFSNCNNLEEFKCPSTLRKIGMAVFYECKRLNKVELNEGLEEIEGGAFLGCKSLTSINLPSSIKKISPMLFESSGIRKITLDENILEIEDSAFFDAVNLKEVNILNPNCIIASNAFLGCNNLIEGYIAAGYPSEVDEMSMLLFSILVFSSFDKHTDEIKDIAIDYVNNNLRAMLERIIITNNVKVLNTLINLKLVKGDLEEYINRCFELKHNELIALLLKANSSDDDLLL